MRGVSFVVRHVSAAQAATRRVPLTRQCTRQFTDKRRAALKDSLRSRVYPRTCDAAFRDTSGQARRSSRDRKSTRLNSSHGYISYAVFCLKKKKTHKSQLKTLTTCRYA